MENKTETIKGLNDNTVYIRSRYGDFHKLIPVEGMGENVRRLMAAEEWMPVQCSFDGHFGDDVEEKELHSVDTDGGPYMTPGFVVTGLLNGEKFEKEIKRIFYKKGNGFLIEF